MKRVCAFWKQATGSEQCLLQRKHNHYYTLESPLGHDSIFDLQIPQMHLAFLWESSDVLNSKEVRYYSSFHILAFQTKSSYQTPTESEGEQRIHKGARKPRGETTKSHMESRRTSWENDDIISPHPTEIFGPCYEQTYVWPLSYV